jgi:thiol-disulfide isomerase/thioredoxin
MSRLFLVVLALLFSVSAHAAGTRPFAKGSWQELRAAHSGRPTIVHLWSLTCAPCLAELPQWSDRVGKGADLVMVATDPVEQAPRLEAMLGRAGLAQLESWAFADPFAESLRFEIDRRWRGELPRTLLIGADGRVEALSGTVAQDVLTDWLKRQEQSHATRP